MSRYTLRASRREIVHRRLQGTHNEDHCRTTVAD
jgi:hypothetical protein